MAPRVITRWYQGVPGWYHTLRGGNRVVQRVIPTTFIGTGNAVYLFPALFGDISVDTLPCSPCDTSDMCGANLTQMGSKPQGYRVHRCGTVTRCRGKHAEWGQ